MSLRILPFIVAGVATVSLMGHVRAQGDEATVRPHFSSSHSRASVPPSPCGIAALGVGFFGLMRARRG